MALSGGIDSSLVAAIAVDALGSENVVGVSMPSRFSSEGSVVDAKLLADNLGIELWTLPIEQPFEAMLDTLAPQFEGMDWGIAEENVQSRIRGNLIMALSNKFGWLVLTTGNKSEMATGYATIYGDMSGGFAVIKDVPKIMCYELSEYRNSQSDRPVIPLSVIEKPPSAELRPDQLDEDSLPSLRASGPYPQGICRRRHELRGDSLDRRRPRSRQARDRPSGQVGVQAASGCSGYQDHASQLWQRPPDADCEQVAGLAISPELLPVRGGAGSVSGPSRLGAARFSPRTH